MQNLCRTLPRKFFFDPPTRLRNKCAPLTHVNVKQFIDCLLPLKLGTWTKTKVQTVVHTFQQFVHLFKRFTRTRDNNRHATRRGFCYNHAKTFFKRSKHQYVCRMHPKYFFLFGNSPYKCHAPATSTIFGTANKRTLLRTLSYHGKHYILRQ